MKTKHNSIIIACCALFAAAGCKPKSAGISDIQATDFGDRHIRLLIEGGAWLGPGDDGFTVNLPGHELVIGKERVLLDKKEAAKVPADAKRFVVILKSGTLTVSADGTGILNTPLAK